jgi:hypothetical protein
VAVAVAAMAVAAAHAGHIVQDYRHVYSQVDYIFPRSIRRLMQSPLKSCLKTFLLPHAFLFWLIFCLSLKKNLHRYHTLTIIDV